MSIDGVRVERDKDRILLTRNNITLLDMTIREAMLVGNKLLITVSPPEIVMVDIAEEP